MEARVNKRPDVFNSAPAKDDCSDDDDYVDISDDDDNTLAHSSDIRNG